MATKTKPITLQVELRRIHVSKQLSEETTAFTADIHIDGKRVGYASNHGHGGNTFVDVRGEAGERLREYAHSLGVKYSFPADERGSERVYYHTDEDIIDDLLDAHVVHQDYVRKCKTHLVFRLDSDSDGVYREYNEPYNPELAALVRKEYGGDLKEIINETLGVGLDVDMDLHRKKKMVAWIRRTCKTKTLLLLKSKQPAGVRSSLDRNAKFSVLSIPYHVYQQRGYSLKEQLGDDLLELVNETVGLEMLNELSPSSIAGG
jgi:hypothetical protein